MTTDTERYIKYPEVIVIDFACDGIPSVADYVWKENTFYKMPESSIFLFRALNRT